jgi:signal peptidase II
MMVGPDRRTTMTLGFGVAAVVVVLDQLSKALILAVLADAGLNQPIGVGPVFNLILTFNRGVSFGLFNAAGSGGRVEALVFSLVAGAIVVGLVWWLARAASLLLAVAIGLIIGGAVGNVVDRLRLGAVVDFLDFHIGSWHWPAFNVADSAICIGVAAMLFDGLLLRRRAS